jgi:hypothetical protein
MACIFKREKKNGSSTWYIRYRDHDGREIKEKVPLAETKRQADLKLAQRLMQVEEGTLPALARQKKVSLVEILDEFVEFGKAHKRSWDRDELSTTHLKRFFGDVPACTVTAARIEGYVAKRKMDKEGEVAAVSQQLSTASCPV